TRTPFRFTLGGGGTDLPSYYSKYGGFIFAAAINKYMFINLNRPVVDDLVRVKYTKSGMVHHREELEHDIAKEALRMMGVESMHYIKELGYKILDAVESGNITDVGLLFDQHRQYKKRISAKMSNGHFDKIYENAKENGALGGKISGAGGAGSLCFM
ncbi:MAG: galactokinase, partial [Deltaproteobacteria bacterium]